MSEYKAGDKFIVEIEEGHNGYYKLKELALWVPAETLERLVLRLAQFVDSVDVDGRTKGQQEAWELAQRLVKFESDGGIDVDDLAQIFDNDNICWIMRENTYQEAAAKVEAWEQKKNAPKLTAKERAFCEVVNGGYITRDADNSIICFYHKPRKKDGVWWHPHSGYRDLNEEFFPFIKWEDEEPWSIKDLLALEVE